MTTKEEPNSTPDPDAGTTEALVYDPRPDPPHGALTEGRGITAAFTELIREGKACTYELFRRAARREMETATVTLIGNGNAEHGWGPTKARVHIPLASSKGGPSMLETTLGPFLDERDELLGHFRADGGGDYGATLNRALRTWEAIVPEKHDAKGEYYIHHRRPVNGPHVEGLPSGSKIIPTSAEVPMEERYTRWIEEFTAEVQLCVDQFTDAEELPRELTRLIDTLRAFEVGTGAGAPLIEHLRSTGSGKDILEMMKDGKERLLGRLGTFMAANAKATVSPEPTFRELLGEENLATVLAAIEGLGYRPVPTKGKGQIIAAMEAALEHFGVAVPIAKHWPRMLNEQFPGINASPKAAPPSRAAYRTAAYKEARTAMLDRLKE